MAQLKTAAFTVHGTEKQSLRWKRAASGEGFPSVGAWLAEVADLHLQGVARGGRPIPLAWARFGRFKVHLLDGRELDVTGRVSAPFGIYRGTPLGPGLPACHRLTLVYVPTGRIIATLRTERDCRALAGELARTWVRGNGSEPSTDPAPILKPYL